MQTLIENPNSWKRRTTLERRLTLISILAFTALISFAQNAHGRPKENVCLSADCIQSASSVLQRMRPEADPCDNFYAFTCRTFVEKTAIPEDKSTVGVYSEIEDHVQEQLRELISEERPITDPSHFRLPNMLYKACMNTTLIEELGAVPLKKIVDSLGGWPVLMGEAWDVNNSWTWQEAVKKFSSLGFSMDYIIDFSIGTDLENATKRMLDIDQSDLAISRDFLEDSPVEIWDTSYFSHMVDTAVLFGADKVVARVELRKSLEFEMDLAKISLSPEKRRNLTALYNPLTIGQLQKSYPYVQWLDYINALLPKGLTVDEDEPINVVVPTFFDELGNLLEITPKRVIANYMMWRIHFFSVDFLSKEYREPAQEFFNTFTGREEQQARSKQCVNLCSASLPIAVGALYVRKHFHEGSKAEAIKMVNNIRDVYDKLLDELDWMDDKTKKHAKAKLNAMATHIGYPNELLDDSKISEYYQNLDIDPEHYFESVLRINVFANDNSFNKLREPVNKTDWRTHASAAIVNAYYSAQENSIHFPAAILQGLLFNARLPKYMNYGGIGSVIGHEITHGFDDRGRQNDLEGNLVNWWEPQTEETYLKKAKCIIYQYGNFTEPLTRLNVNGLRTLGENIADNGGIKQSYLAYRHWAMKNGPEPKLPGLDYTPEQMFWISYGQSECSKSRRAYMESVVISDSHSPARFRVIGSLRNIKDFAKDFHCPEGTFMNPVEKCEVW